MKVAHFATVAPNRCGLYGTARDLIASERLVGLDSGLIDASIAEKEPVVNGIIEGYPRIKDDSVNVQSVEWAEDADCFVRHSFIPLRFQNIKKPLIMAVHGRPESSFILEVSGRLPAISTFFKRARDERYKAFLCFWPEYMFIWSTLIPHEKLFYVPAPVDLEYYKPNGKKFDWKDKNGYPNILIADIWREDIIPFNLIFAAVRFQQLYCKTAKIHIVALQGANLKSILGFLSGIKECGALGLISPMTTKIKDFYSAADIFITPHIISTRTVREPLACGIPIVASSGNRYTPYTANPMDIDAFAKAINECWQDLKGNPKKIKNMARKTAEIAFNFERTGMAMKEVLGKIL